MRTERGNLLESLFARALQASTMLEGFVALGGNLLSIWPLRIVYTASHNFPPLSSEGLSGHLKPAIKGHFKTGQR